MTGAMVTTIVGDCRTVLPTLPAGSAHCCVTSPPYWGLRDYGTATWEGADARCDHAEMITGMSDKNTLGPDGHLPPTNAANVGRTRQYRDFCRKCGARRIDSQIGLEPTPEEYVAALVAVFREVRRALRDDGTLWLNLGDSYNGSGGTGGATEKQATNTGSFHGGKAKQSPGLKPKDLVGIPWRVAFALQADGWYLRQDIIWHKPNPMPESVTDRCTKAHEYIFLLSKSARYYYDAEAVSEPVTENTVARLSQPTRASQAGSDRVPGKTNGNMKAVPPRFGGSKYGDDETEHTRTKSGNDYAIPGDGKRNRRSVWTVATQPYSGAHFATFPPALILPCILAGCPDGGTVLDPFGGSGTTGAVASGNGRRAILIELNPDYVAMQHARVGELFCGEAD